MPHADIPETHRSNAKAMRRDMTDAELKLWNELRAHRLMGLSFRRQLPIAGYIVDFACSKHKLVIEVDGSQHNDDSNIERDLKRTEKLTALGWAVFRVTNDNVLKNIDDVCTGIVRMIGLETFR